MFFLSFFSSLFSFLLLLLWFVCLLVCFVVVVVVVFVVVVVVLSAMSRYETDDCLAVLTINQNVVSHVDRRYTESPVCDNDAAWDVGGT